MLKRQKRNREIMVKEVKQKKPYSLKTQDFFSVDKSQININEKIENE